MKWAVRVSALGAVSDEPWSMTSQAPLSRSNDLLKGLTATGFVGIGAGLAAMVVLHATSGLNPAFDVISAHLYTPLGWLLPLSLALFALGASSFGLLAHAVGGPRWLTVGLFVWSGFIALVALFPTDPPEATEYSAIHFVHRYSAFLAFCTMAFLGFAFNRWAGRDGRCSQRCRRAVAVCSWVAVGSLAVTSAPYVLDFLAIEAPRWTDAAGLNQRMTVGSELLLLAVVGGWLRLQAPAVPAAAGRAAVREPVLAA